MACRRCQAFEDEPAALELAIPGLSSLSSAYAAVMGDDGLCRRHDRLTSGGKHCIDFVARRTP